MTLVKCDFGDLRYWVTWGFLGDFGEFGDLRDLGYLRESFDLGYLSNLGDFWLIG